MRPLETTTETFPQDSLLGELDAAALGAFLERAKRVRLADGEILFRQGEQGNSAYLVVTGAVEVIVESVAGNVTMTVLGPRQIVGETAVFTDLERTATVRAAGDTELLRLERSHFAEIVTRYPTTAFRLIGTLGRRVHALNQPLVLLSLAAQALESPTGDSETLARIAEGNPDIGLFAQSFRKIVREMESKQARRQELMVAARIQQSILPRPPDLGRDWQLAAFMKPARDIGGDFYDCFTPREGRLVIVVADVSGKGIPAALFMAVSRTLIRAAIMSGSSIEHALAAANTQLEAENEESMFVTLFVSELDTTSGRLKYVNAGHCEGWLRRRGGELLKLERTGPAMGIRAKVNFVAQDVDMQVGDLLFLTSDGVNEAFSSADEQFGEGRLRTALEASPPTSAAQVLERVAGEVATFTAGAEQSDDITCLALFRS